MVVHCCFDTRGGVRALYGVGLQGIKNYIIDLLGFGVIFHSPIFIGGWYLTAIVIYYFLFPILYYATKKFRVLFLIITYTPWIYYIVMNDIDMHTDWWLFYVFSFALGIYLSQMEILNNQKQKRFSKTGIIFSIILFIAAFILRAYITLPMDPLLAFSMIELEIYIFSKMSVFSSFLCRCGSQSANIWLLHGVVLGLISGLCFTSYYMRCVFLVFLCMGISIVIEEIKRALKYNELVSKIRKYIA